MLLYHNLENHPFQLLGHTAKILKNLWLLHLQIATCEQLKKKDFLPVCTYDQVHLLSRQCLIFCLRPASKKTWVAETARACPCQIHHEESHETLWHPDDSPEISGYLVCQYGTSVAEYCDLFSFYSCNTSSTWLDQQRRRRRRRRSAKQKWSTTKTFFGASHITTSH